METPKLGHAPIDMRLVTTDMEDWMDAIIQRGDFSYRVDTTGTTSIWIAIPSKHSNGTDGWVLAKWEIGGPNKRWDLTGPTDKPTMYPSLHAIGVWHGWVRDGQLIEA